MPGTHYPIEIALCDDNAAERLTIKQLVEEYLDINGYLANISEFESGEQLLENNVERFNLVILDVFMSGMNGIETAKQFVSDHPSVQVIFCSTSKEYAADSYDVSALRYFLKPVDKQKLFSTLDFFFHAYTAVKTLTYKQNRMDESVFITDVLWIEAGDHKSIIHTRSDDIVTRTSFSSLLSQLEAYDFVKPIRFAAVALNQVAAIPTDVFTLRDGTVVPISKDKRAAMKKAYTDYKMKTLLKKGGDR